MKEKQAGWEVNNPVTIEKRVADLEERLDIWDRRLAKWAKKMKLEE